MLKYIFSCFFSFLILNTAIARTADTSIVFLWVTGDYTIKVASLDQASYYRLILPPDPGDDRYNLKEFSRDGKLKLTVKIPAGSSLRDRTSAMVTFDGECTSYFPNGVKSSISYYKNGNKDAEGNELCKNGNGRWVTYFDDFKTIKLEGRVVNGEMDGEWHFIALNPDTIKYTCKYKKGFPVSSVGYDKHGNAFPFQNEEEKASYRSGQITFLEVLRSHIKMPKDTNGNKMSMDTAHVSFVIEKDGRLDDFSILGDVDTKIKEAVFAGLGKCHGWNPERYFGVPFRTQIIFPLSEFSGFTPNRGYYKAFEYRERILKGD